MNEDNSKITNVMTIQRRGSSLVLTVTKIVTVLGLGLGDKIKVTFEKVDE